jgi:hypothetical protein
VVFRKLNVPDHWWASHQRHSAAGAFFNRGDGCDSVEVIIGKDLGGWCP